MMGFQKVAIHSFKGGTGKSNLTASIAAVLATQGRTVGILDLDLTAPGQHEIFRLDQGKARATFDDFLWGHCPIEEAAVDVTPQAKAKGGRLYLVPASMKLEDIQRVLKRGYEVAQFASGLSRLEEARDLDMLLLDTHPGIGEDSLLALAASDVIYVCFLMDRQHYTGTAILLELADMMGKDVRLIVNKVPTHYSPQEVREKVEDRFGRPVAAVIPFEQEVMATESSEVVALTRPSTHFSAEVHRIVEGLSGGKKGAG